MIHTQQLNFDPPPQWATGGQETVSDKCWILCSAMLKRLATCDPTDQSSESQAPVLNNFGNEIRVLVGTPMTFLLPRALDTSPTPPLPRKRPPRHLRQTC